MVDGLADALTHRPLIALVTLFGAGLVTSLTPCIYPMIPITAGILSGTSAGQPSRARTARLTLAYVTGLALFYAILGLFAGLSGSLFGTVSASPWARFAIGNLLLVFALAMFDVIPVSAPQRLMRWAAGLGGGSYPAVFLLGATSGVVAARCGAARHGGVLLHSDGTSPVTRYGWVLTLALALPPVLEAQDIGLAVGTQAPAVTVEDLDGKPVDLGRHIGKHPVMLEFWATWCPLCKALEPALKAAHARYGATVQFIAIGVGVNETPASIKRHLAAHPLPFPVWYDANGAAVRAYQAPTTSYIVVLDKAGKVRYTGAGAEQDVATALEQVVGN